MSQISCPSCGASVESTERACSYCGAALGAAPVSSSAPTVRVSKAAVEAMASGGDPLQAVRDEVARGNKIEAIRLYREATGVGLKEAKDAVEAMEDGKTVIGSAATLISTGPLLAFGNSAEAMDAIKAELRAGRKIEAIKIYREYFNVGLAEAKTAVEQTETNLQFETVISSRSDTDIPAFAQPEAPAAGPVLTPNPIGQSERPAWQKWAIGCAIALVLLCLCSCIGIAAFIFSGNGVQF